MLECKRILSALNPPVRPTINIWIYKSGETGYCSVRLNGALTNGVSSCGGHRESKISSHRSHPEMLEALMCTQGVSHTDSSEEWATSWSWTRVKEGAEACLLGCVEWAAEVRKGGSEPEMWDWDEWPCIPFAAPGVGSQMRLLMQKTNLTITQTRLKMIKNI